MQRSSLVVLASLGVVALLTTARISASKTDALDGGSSSSARLQQRTWQSRWRASYSRAPPSAPTDDTDAPTAASASVPTPISAVPPPSPPAVGQAPEARQAIATALTQLIPPKGDGRRGGFDDQRNVKRESDTVRRMLRQDSLADWRPDPSLLPEQLPAGASMAQLLKDVPVNGTAWLAFGNAGVTEMLMNWVHWVLKLGLGNRFVIAAFDDELLLHLRSLRLPAYNCASLPLLHGPVLCDLTRQSAPAHLVHSPWAVPWAVSRLLRGLHCLSSSLSSSSSWSLRSTS